jgi:hypothetical protein
MKVAHSPMQLEIERDDERTTPTGRRTVNSKRKPGIGVSGLRRRRTGEADLASLLREWWK